MASPFNTRSNFTESIGRVSTMAGRTGGEAERLLSAADTLSGQAGLLRTQVDGLLGAMRAA